jgi:hypothetical protein
VDFKGVEDKMGLYPNIPYQPVLGLVDLFARSASLTLQNPRAPHSHPRASIGFSYAVVAASPMDNGRFTGGNREVNHRLGGSLSTIGNGGQGSSFARGGFQLANQGFHPGYAT